jgi:hypothetical protein
MRPRRARPPRRCAAPESGARSRLAQRTARGASSALKAASGLPWPSRRCRDNNPSFRKGKVGGRWRPEAKQKSASQCVTAAEWVRSLAEAATARRIALVGPTAADVRDTMIEGESGLLAIAPNSTEERSHYGFSLKRSLRNKNATYSLGFATSLLSNWCDRGEIRVEQISRQRLFGRGPLGDVPVTIRRIPPWNSSAAERTSANLKVSKSLA